MVYVKYPVAKEEIYKAIALATKKEETNDISLLVEAAAFDEIFDMSIDDNILTDALDKGIIDYELSEKAAGDAVDSITLIAKDNIFPIGETKLIFV